MQSLEVPWKLVGEEQNQNQSKMEELLMTVVKHMHTDNQKAKSNKMTYLHTYNRLSKSIITAAFSD